MLVCINKECANFNQELVENTELCPLCGLAPEQRKATNNVTLGAVAMIVSFISFLMLFSEFFYLSFFIAPASVVLAFFSKSKLFIILSIGIVLFMAGFIILYIKPF